MRVGIFGVNQRINRVDENQSPYLDFSKLSSWVDMIGDLRRKALADEAGW